MGYFRDSVSVKETTPHSKVKEVVWSNSCFQQIDSEIVKDMSAFFRKAQSADVFHYDCDGITIFEENGKKYMFLSELKSTFDSRDILHAREQIISSYIKINMAMNLLHCYNANEFIAKGFIVCLPHQKEYVRDLHKAQFLPGGSQYKEEAKLVLDLCYRNDSKKTIIKPSDCYKLKGLPLGDRCLFNEMELYLIEVPHGTERITLNVNDYI